MFSLDHLNDCFTKAREHDIGVMAGIPTSDSCDYFLLSRIIFCHE